MSEDARERRSSRYSSRLRKTSASASCSASTGVMPIVSRYGTFSSARSCSAARSGRYVPVAASWIHSSPWGHRPAMRAYGRCEWRTNVNAPCFTSSDSVRESALRRTDRRAARDVALFDALGDDARPDHAVAPDPRVLGDLRALAHDRDAAVDDVRPLVVRRPVISVADVCVLPDEDAFVDDRALDNCARLDAAVVEDDRVAHDRALFDVHAWREH